MARFSPRDAVDLGDYIDIRRLADAAERYAAIGAGVSYKQAACCLRFDDGDIQSQTVVEPELLSRNLVAGFAIVKDRIGTANNLTAAQITTLQEKGHEIMSHSRTHTDMASLAAWKDEVLTATDEMRALGWWCDTFVQVGVSTGDNALDTPAKADDSVRGWLLRSKFAGSWAYVTTGNTINATRPLPAVRRYGGDRYTGDQASLATLKTKITEAQASGGFVQILFHAEGIGAGGQITLADFKLFLDFIAAERDAGRLDVLTPLGCLYAQQRDTKRNLLGDGDFELSAAPGTFRFWHVEAGAPTLEDGQGVGASRCARVSPSNSISVYLPAGGVRSIYIEAQAKSVGAGNATARIIVRNMDGAGATVGTQRDVQTVVTDSAFAPIKLHAGAHPSATQLRVWFLAGAGSLDVRFDNVKVHKV